MKKFTLLIASLFITIGAMAQSYTFEKITLTEDMLYTNAPCTNTQWGDQFTSYTVLLDDNSNTFLHTEYANNGASLDGLDHYLRVDLGAGNEISAFKFNYTTRGGNVGYDFPQKFTIAGSNEENGTYTEIGRVESGLPTSAGSAWESTVFTSETAYRYLRFMVTETSTDRKGQGVEHNYWHMGEFALYKATEEVRTEYVHNTSSINRGDRRLTSFTITDGINDLTVSDIQTSSTSPVYADKTTSKFTTLQGATLKFKEFNYVGSWMHAYAYIDYNKDYNFTLTNNNDGEGDGEIVSYNYYNGTDITGATGNTNGTAISGTYGDSKAMPAFTLPADLPVGEYRVRIKIDWDNIDADNGSSSIADDGGCQCDFVIVVEENVGNELAKVALAQALASANTLLDAVTIGDAVGQYSGTYTGAEIESVLASTQNFYDQITDETPVDSVQGYVDIINEAIASYSLNMPKAGDYFRIMSVSGWNDDAPYLASANATEGQTTRAAFVDGANANTIFYYDGTQLIAYASGHYIVNRGNFAGYNGIQTNGTQVTFRASSNTSMYSAYNICFKGNDDADRWLYANTANYTDAGASCGSEGGYNFNLEAVTELPVTVTAAGYATLYAPVALTVPTGVTAHTVTLNGEWATLSEALPTIPASTGVVLVGEGSHSFAITTADAFEGENALEGTVAATYITKDAYVLGYINVAEEGEEEKKEVGFYTATKNQAGNTAFLNNHHKAYLPKTTGMNAVSYSFRFGEGTTGIEQITENRVQSTVIYDLTGRRVETITEPGIYIVNGVKKLVK